MFSQTLKRCAAAMTSAQLKALAKYTACDVSDVLLKLNVPGAGFFADIAPLKGYSTRTIAPASTIDFAPKTTPSFPDPIGATLNSFSLADDAGGIAPGTPYADLIKTSTIVVLSQPAGQVCAVVGGINAVRMEQLGALGILVSGRVRDLETLKGLKMPVWSRGTSSVGAGGQSTAHTVNCPLVIGNVVVCPGDIIMLDPAENSAVAIPEAMLDGVLALLPKLTAADEKCMADVQAGGTVKAAFATHRGK